MGIFCKHNYNPLGITERTNYFDNTVYLIGLECDKCRKRRFYNGKSHIRSVMEEILIQLKEKYQKTLNQGTEAKR